MYAPAAQSNVHTYAPSAYAPSNTYFTPSNTHMYTSSNTCASSDMYALSSMYSPHPTSIMPPIRGPNIPDTSHTMGSTSNSAVSTGAYWGYSIPLEQGTLTHNSDTDYDPTIIPDVAKDTDMHDLHFTPIGTHYLTPIPENEDVFGLKTDTDPGHSVNNMTWNFGTPKNMPTSIDYNDSQPGSPTPQRQRSQHALTSMLATSMFQSHDFTCSTDFTEEDDSAEHIDDTEQVVGDEEEEDAEGDSAEDDGAEGDSAEDDGTEDDGAEDDGTEDGGTGGDGTEAECSPRTLGRITHESRDKMNEGFLEISVILARLAESTDLPLNVIMNQWKLQHSTPKKSANHWNLYQQYFECYPEREYRRVVPVGHDQGEVPLMLYVKSTLR